MARQDTDIIPFDFDTYAESFLRYLKVNLPNDFQDFLESNAARVLVDAIAFEMSLLAFMVNANLKQMFITTASTRRAMFLLGKLVNYDLRGPVPSSSVLRFFLDIAHTQDIVIPKGTQAAVPGAAPIVFETDNSVTLVAGDLFVEAAATQGTTTVEILGTTTDLPNQTFKSSKPPLITTLIVIIDNIVWESVDNIFDLTESQRGYTAKPDENGLAVITFGNGIFGAIPPTGKDVNVEYRVGGGANTNVGSNDIIEIVTTVLDITGAVVSLQVTNPDPAFGGLEEESLEEARVNIPRAVRSMDRFVSREDFQAVPQQFTSASAGTVFKSTATVKYTWAEHIITIFILGEPPSGRLQSPTLPDQVLRDALREFVEERTLPTVAISVENARLVEVDLTAEVFFLQNFREADVRARLIDALDNLVFSNELREIGDGLRVSDICAALDNVVGVDYINLKEPAANRSVLLDEYIVPGTITLTLLRIPKNVDGNIFDTNC